MSDARPKPLVRFCELKERRSAKGKVYLTGLLGALKLIAFRNPDEDPDDIRSPTWIVHCQEREAALSRRAASTPAERGKDAA